MTEADSSEATPFIHRHPWIILVAIFSILIGAWAAMYITASRNRPEKVPLEQLDEIPRSTPGFPATPTPTPTPDA